MTLWRCLHLTQFEFEVVIDFGRVERVLKSGQTFANPLNQIDHPIIGINKHKPSSVNSVSMQAYGSIRYEKSDIACVHKLYFEIQTSLTNSV